MGKHKKQLRLEKSKVKLKKKPLPKGQNITDTSFKTRSIVITEQFKTTDESQPLSSRKLNVKELVTRLKHYNDTVRQNAVAGLKEIIITHTESVLGSYFYSLVMAITELIVSEVMRNIRREALKLLQLIMAQVSVEKVTPFFSALQWNLNCAMTHINPKIQEDSLLLFDILLEASPSLVASRASHILPNFLNMISKLRSESQLDRTLTVNLQSKLTTVKWRIQVLTRLRYFLGAIVAQERRRLKGPESTGCKNLRWGEEGASNVTLFNPAYSELCVLPDLFHRSEGPAAGDDEIQGYVKQLMPLLFETWLEVGPGKEAEGRQEKVGLNEEALDLLKSISQIIYLLWDYIHLWEQKTKNETLVIWFKTMFEKDFNRYIMSGFPYTQMETSNTIKKSKKQDMFQEPSNVTSGSKTSEHNLIICHLYLCISTSPVREVTRNVSEYVKKHVTKWTSGDNNAASEQFVKVLGCLLGERFMFWSKYKAMAVPSILEAVVSTSLSRKREIPVLFHLLIHLVLDIRLKNLARSPVLQPWIASLPDLLCQPVVPSTVIKCLGKLACHNNRTFHTALLDKLPHFIRNLGSVVVSGYEKDPLEGRKNLADFLYWAPKLSPSTQKLLDEQLLCWDANLASHVTELLAMRPGVKTSSTQEVPELISVL
uniref:Pre-rRNA-processing protein Ipi1 N-terminal domain-containing protein n=1 Tax=Timema cristinae TaxID=61476 RepID=A0A7R9GTA3_TIMCR|nr:unnamed protein product [Timema cristinae]